MARQSTKGRRTISIPVEEEFVPFVEAQLATLRTQFKIVDTGVLQLTLAPPAALAPARKTHVSSDAVFRRRGGIWHLRLMDAECMLPDRKGLRYIHELLESPGNAIPALRLAAGDEAFERLRQGRQPLLDYQTERELRAAISTGSEEASEVARYVRSATGRAGRTRTFATEPERARGAVHKAIGSAIAAIDLDCPALSRHLRESIDTGNFCVYRPITLVEWQL